ncbi:hypothetical protein AUP68_11944 [Ilyonectria robusta]
MLVGLGKLAAGRDRSSVGPIAVLGAVPTLRAAIKRGYLHSIAVSVGFWSWSRSVPAGTHERSPRRTSHAQEELHIASRNLA